jgi:hypothetical protein
MFESSTEVRLRELRGLFIEDQTSYIELIVSFVRKAGQWALRMNINRNLRRLPGLWKRVA